MLTDPRVLQALHVQRDVDDARPLFEILAEVLQVREPGDVE